MQATRTVARVWIGAALALAVAASGAAADGIPELDLHAGPATRLLVIAPHPDDEALGAAGLMQRVLAAGGSVRVVLMTSGDAFPEGVEAATGIQRPGPRDFRNYGNLRERESIAAMQRLGLTRSHLLFLGFPDGGLCLIASNYLSAKARAFDSPYTGREQPPSYEQLVPGVRYRGIDIRREIERIVLAYRPTIVVMPHPDDEHPDHCATYIFAREALDEIAARYRDVAPRVLHYLVHYGQWPVDLPPPAQSPLQPPAGFPSGEGAWRTLTLSPQEAAMKDWVVGNYATQLLVIGRFMRAFARSNALFIEGRPASLPECWCDSTHVATEKPPSQYRRRPSRHR